MISAWFSSSQWRAQHHRPTCYLAANVRGQIDCSFSVQSVRRGHFTGSEKGTFHWELTSLR